MGLDQGCIYQIDVRKDPSGYELLPTLLGDMISAGLRPNKATHALFCEAYLLEGLAEVGRPPCSFPLTASARLTSYGVRRTAPSSPGVFKLNSSAKT